jgi:adenylate cyclase
MYIQATITTFGLIAASVYYAFRLAENAKAETDALLRNILPDNVVERLKAKPAEPVADTFADASILFADISGFVPLARRLGASETVALLNRLVSMFDALAEQHGVEKIKTIGDSYMVVGGVPNRDPLHCQHIADFALEAQAFIVSYAEGVPYPLQMRTGIHTGTVAAGIVGRKRFSYDLWGDVVNVASRFESTGQPDKIHVSEAVKVRLSDDYLFLDDGTVELKGKEATRSFFLIGKKTLMPGILEFATTRAATASPS